MRLLLLAPPGAGKGTQGERLAAWSGVRHIAAGDLLRAQARAGGPLGDQIAACQARGDLVPDQIVLDVLTPVVVAAAEGPGKSGTAAEGPGKSGTAAEGPGKSGTAAEGPGKLDTAASGGGYILDGFPRTLPQAIAAAELAARLGVSLDAAIYLHAPDAVLTRRLLDRASQSGRSDDRADVIRHRLRVYAETTGPLVPYYAERGILIPVDADQPPDSVTSDITAQLSALPLTRPPEAGM